MSVIKGEVAMFFYRFTCSRKIDNGLKGKDDISIFAKRDKDIYIKYCEENDDRDMQLFIVEDDNLKLIFDIIFDKDLNELRNVDTIAENFVKLIGEEFKSISKVEITFSGLDKDIRNSYDNEFIENLNDIYSKFEIEQGGNHHFKENMLSKQKFDKKSLLELCDKYALNEQVKEEIERIYALCDNTAFGVPVHYIVNMDKEMGNNTIDVLLKALHTNGRMIRDKYAKLFLSRLRKMDMDLFFEISSAIKMNEGGVVVLYCDLEVDDGDRYSRELDILNNLCRVCEFEANSATLIFQFYSNKCGQINYIKNNLNDFAFVELQDRAFYDYDARNYLLQSAKRRKIENPEGLLELIEPNKTYEVFELIDIFKKWYNNYLYTKQFPQYSMFINNRVEDKKEDSKNSAYNELNKLIGLDNVKKVVTDFINYSKLQRACELSGDKIMQLSRHMCFVGNPGTAKTTVARIVAGIMKEEGLLSKGQLIEVGRANLVSKFVGGTAPKVKEIFHRAIGNVLFIDEAYSLCDGKEGLYGDEAINTIVQEMENNRENMVIIFAGYKNEMQRFLNRNSGLRSRIAFEVEFPDYDTDELLKIAKFQAEKMNIDISMCRDKMTEIFSCEKNTQNFGNGRFVRNLLEKARMKQATRLVNENMLFSPERNILLPEDIELPKIIQEKLSFGFHI